MILFLYLEFASICPSILLFTQYIDVVSQPKDLSLALDSPKLALVAIESGIVLLSGSKLAATQPGQDVTSAVAPFSNLEKLWFGRCKLIMDMGIGFTAVGCKKLRLI
ncbi:hypothetical protein K1719_040562 [Acacia pycnantha]|nr:hypothetical protein K1719_040562 [Acacia pycnantha]